MDYENPVPKHLYHLVPEYRPDQPYSELDELVRTAAQAIAKGNVEVVGPMLQAVETDGRPIAESWMVQRLGGNILEFMRRQHS